MTISATTAKPCDDVGERYWIAGAPVPNSGPFGAITVRASRANDDETIAFVHADNAQMVLVALRGMPTLALPIPSSHKLNPILSALRDSMVRSPSLNITAIAEHYLETVADSQNYGVVEAFGFEVEQAAIDFARCVLECLTRRAA
jgi:hypothetical protein